MILYNIVSKLIKCTTSTNHTNHISSFLGCATDTWHFFSKALIICICVFSFSFSYLSVHSIIYLTKPADTLHPVLLPQKNPLKITNSGRPEQREPVLRLHQEPKESFNSCCQLRQQQQLLRLRVHKLSEPGQRCRRLLSVLQLLRARAPPWVCC